MAPILRFFASLFSLTTTAAVNLHTATPHRGTPARRRRQRPRLEGHFRGLKQSKYRVVEYHDPRRVAQNLRLASEGAD